MRSGKYFFIPIIGFVSGVVFHSFFNFGILFSILCVGIGVISLLSLTLLREGRGNGFFIAILICFFGLGLLRYDFSNPLAPEILNERLGTSVELVGIVSEEPDRRENATLLRVSTELLGDTKAEAKMLVNTDRYQDFSYGDEIRLRGIIEEPKNFETDNGRMFDYKKYLEKEGIAYTMFRPRIELLASGKGNIVTANLFKLKHLLLDTLQKIIPQPESSLLGGLLLGGRDALSSDMQDVFRKAGIIHIVVLSGYNITIVAEAIMRVFSFLPLYFRLGTGALSIFLFAVMTGGSSTVIRASLMALIVLLARAIGRKYDISRALMLAGFFMVIQNPRILIFDLSFQLSFLATIGLIYVSPLIENLFKRAPSFFQFRELLVATLSTQICVLPLLLYTNGLFSVVGLPVNLLVLPLIPLTMLVGFMSGVVGLLSATLAVPIAYLAYLLLRYEIVIPQLAVSLPYASLSIPYFPAWLMTLSYGVLALVFLMYRKKFNEPSSISLQQRSS